MITFPNFLPEACPYLETEGDGGGCVEGIKKRECDVRVAWERMGKSRQRGQGREGCMTGTGRGGKEKGWNGIVSVQNIPPFSARKVREKGREGEDGGREIDKERVDEK